MAWLEAAVWVAGISLAILGSVVALAWLGALLIRNTEAPPPQEPPSNGWVCACGHPRWQHERDMGPCYTCACDVFDETAP
jgi:hypothetical protein